MYKNIKTKLIILFSVFLLAVSCSNKKQEIKKSNKIDAKTSSVSNAELLKQSEDVERSFIDQQTSLELKKLSAQIIYLQDQVSKLEVKSELYADPFEVYNKEIVLSNGSSIFCKILSQDKNEIFVETLIGNLTINKKTVVRIVENITVLEDDNTFIEEITEISDDEAVQILSDAELIERRKQQSSASLKLLGDVNEIKDKSGNTILSGEIKNVGTQRADLVRIDFTLRTNWQGDIEILTAYVSGASYVFKKSGIVSNSSVLPGAIAPFKIIIPQSLGNFIGYSYDIYWDYYE